MITSPVTEKGILFTTRNIIAIQEKNKTNTRRIHGLEIVNKAPDLWAYIGQEDQDGDYFVFKPKNNPLHHGISCRLGYNKGDLLYLRETHRLSVIEQGRAIQCEYKSDGRFRYFPYKDIPDEQRIRLKTIKTLDKWRSGRFMYKFLARYWIKILSIEIERLHDISLDDIIAEGVKLPFLETQAMYFKGMREEFSILWDSINGKTYPWASNPWVAVFRFCRISKF